MLFPRPRLPAETETEPRYRWGSVRVDYFTAFERTSELLGKLEGFLRAEETHASLERWAQSALPAGSTHGAPIGLNRAATRVLTSLCSATTLHAIDQTPIFRAEDARDYMALLRRGEGRKLTRLVGSLTASLPRIQQQLRFPTEREVAPGVGWLEYLRFASPATGRTFLLEQRLQRFGGEPEVVQGRLSTEDDGDAHECLFDLLETLAIDLTDLGWRAPEFELVKLPEWVLWRQDDNGVKTAVGTFSGCRKAQAALAGFESLHHKQTYWLEGPPT